VEEEREVMARNTLFLAVTRPALFAASRSRRPVILLTSVITLIGTTNPVYGLVVAAVMFGISRLVVRHDVNAFRLIFSGAAPKRPTVTASFGAGRATRRSLEGHQAQGVWPQWLGPIACRNRCR
jgi:type IV secretion system protein VirB3